MMKPSFILSSSSSSSCLARLLFFTPLLIFVCVVVSFSGLFSTTFCGFYFTTSFCSVSSSSSSHLIITTTTPPAAAISNFFMLLDDVNQTATPPLLSPSSQQQQQHQGSSSDDHEISAAAASKSKSTIEEEEEEKRKKSRSLERIEASLARARYHISVAAQVRNLTSLHPDPDYIPRGPIYRNANAFHRSYLEMEKVFRIYVYEEGEPPLFHAGQAKSLYSTEGSFIHEMEKGQPQLLYKTKDPHQALVFFLPFSVVNLVMYLYKPNSHEINNIGHVLSDYINVISNKHPFWNRSTGADHFMLSCHDWGPLASSFVPQLFNNSIRALCNANTSEGFNPAKDVSFPEINLRTGDIEGHQLGGLSPSRRSILAFFAGRLHGHIRYLLLEEWKNKLDEDVQVYDQLPDNGVSYVSMLQKSRFCLCPSGYEVASPRLVEAIYAECIPVLISDNYVPPFNDILNWKAFSVQIAVKDIPNIKKILMAISSNQYLRMQRRVKQVQRHFVVNKTRKRFDVFHMTLHSVWLRRLNIRITN